MSSTQEFTPSIYEEVAERIEDKEVAERRAEEERHSAYLAKQAEQRRKCVEKKLVFLRPIAEEITAQLMKSSSPSERLTVVLDEENGKLSVGGVDTSWWIEFKEEWTTGHGRYSYGSKPNGKIRIVIGDYGDKTSYPQRKDGGHNHSAIATKLIGLVERKLIADRHERLCEFNATAAQRVREKCGLSTYDRMAVTASSSELAPVILKFDLHVTTTEDRALTIIEGLRALGIRVSFNDRQVRQ